MFYAGSATCVTLCSQCGIDTENWWDYCPSCGAILHTGTFVGNSGQGGLSEARSRRFYNKQRRREQWGEDKEDEEQYFEPQDWWEEWWPKQRDTPEIYTPKRGLEKTCQPLSEAGLEANPARAPPAVPKRDERKLANREPRGIPGAFLLTRGLTDAAS